MIVKVRRRFPLSRAIVFAAENKIVETTCQCVLNNGSIINAIALFSENSVSLQKAIKGRKIKIKANNAKESKVLAKLESKNGTGEVIDLKRVRFLVFK